MELYIHEGVTTKYVTKWPFDLLCAKVTGGGAYKYSELIEKKLGVSITKEDEMQCMIRGCNFLLRNISGIVQHFLRLKSNPLTLGGTGIFKV